MSFKKLFRNISFHRRIEVIHSLPGRLRLGISELARLPEGYVQYLDTLQALLEKLPGVSSVSINHYSRSVLFLYDPDLISEADLLAFIEDLFKDSMMKADDLSNNESIHGRLVKIHKHMETRVEQIRTRHADAQEG